MASILMASKREARRFAVNLGAFYGTLFSVSGAYLPFFPVWLKAVGIEASWIGLIGAVAAITRFTVLPLITSLAERRQALRGGLVITTAATAVGFLLVGTQREALAVFLLFALTSCMWTPTTPLTDAYALRGVAHYGLNYGPLRLWGSASFVLGALLCGLLIDLVPAEHLIWIIVALAWLSVLVSFGLRPLEVPMKRGAGQQATASLLRNRGFLAIIAASALIQGSHAAYYIFSAIVWKQAGFSGLTIAVLWSLGVVAEIVLFALSPRFTLPSAVLVVIAALSAVVRWSITAQEPPIAVLAIVQLAHGLTFGLTQVGIMGLLVQHVPGHVMARGQGYLAACGGIVYTVTAILCGTIYARYGQGVYYLMAAMAAAGALVMWLGRRRLDGATMKTTTRS